MTAQQRSEWDGSFRNEAQCLAGGESLPALLTICAYPRAFKGTFPPRLSARSYSRAVQHRKPTAWIVTHNSQQHGHKHAAVPAHRAALWPRRYCKHRPEQVSSYLKWNGWIHWLCSNVLNTDIWQYSPLQARALRWYWPEKVHQLHHCHSFCRFAHLLCQGNIAPHWYS